MDSTASTVISIRNPEALELVSSLLRQGIRVHIQVSGQSMIPLLNGEEIVELFPITTKKPKRGDIIFFRDRQCGPLLHRLIRHRYRNGVLYLQTKGDACPNFDNLISIGQVLGYVRRILPSPDSTLNAQKKKIIHLSSPFIQLQTFFIVNITLIRYYLGKMKFIFYLL
ncbi:MAG: hypothetical protein D3923_11085 [Candidatus Electrothrix sp. AR3]|nr:hypothetical protein [Candidatus Electrothrix sp. AR3]